MIIILSPGRCGSSTIARLLHTKCNINMGQRFRAPDKSNPQGFFEDLDFRDLNQTALEGKITKQYFQDQLDHLISIKGKVFGVKDPRICNLWPYYRDYGAQYIVCTRRPQLIIKSLILNYGWSEKDSKNLLITRLAGIEKMLEGKDALRIDFSYKREETKLTHLLRNWHEN